MYVNRCLSEVDEFIVITLTNATQSVRICILKVLFRMCFTSCSMTITEYYPTATANDSATSNDRTMFFTS